MNITYWVVESKDTTNGRTFLKEYTDPDEAKSVFESLSGEFTEVQIYTVQRKLLTEAHPLNG